MLEQLMQMYPQLFQRLTQAQPTAPSATSPPTPGALPQFDHSSFIDMLLNHGNQGNPTPGASGGAADTGGGISYPGGSAPGTGPIGTPSNPFPGGQPPPLGGPGPLPNPGMGGHDWHQRGPNPNFPPPNGQGPGMGGGWAGWSPHMRDLSRGQPPGGGTGNAGMGGFPDFSNPRPHNPGNSASGFGGVPVTRY